VPDPLAAARVDLQAFSTLNFATTGRQAYAAGDMEVGWKAITNLRDFFSPHRHIHSPSTEKPRELTLGFDRAQRVVFDEER
jgi:hypothetical protein